MLKTLDSNKALRGAGTNAVLCNSCSVLLCVLEQPRVDNSSGRPIKSRVFAIDHYNF